MTNIAPVSRGIFEIEEASPHTNKLSFWCRVPCFSFFYLYLCLLCLWLFSNPPPHYLFILPFLLLPLSSSFPSSFYSSFSSSFSSSFPSFFSSSSSSSFSSSFTLSPAPSLPFPSLSPSSPPPSHMEDSIGDGREWPTV